MNCNLWQSCVLALFFGVAHAQTIPPVQPQPGLHLKVIELEIRLKGAPTATNSSPTARLINWTPDNVDAQQFAYTMWCWNKASACPPVVGATVRVFLKLPWTARLNVTKYVLCNGTECQLPAFTPIQAKPGEAYFFNYNRITGQWVEAPKIITQASPAPPPPPPIGTSPDGAKMPPASELVDGQGAKWAAAPQTGGGASQIGLTRNGVRVANSVDFATIKAGVIYQFDAGWFRWDGSAFVSSPAP